MDSVPQTQQFDETLEALYKQQLWQACQQGLEKLDSLHEASSPQQRVAHLVYRYRCRTLDGGHLEYFSGDALLYLEETKAALEQVGASAQREVLVKAEMRYLGRYRNATCGLTELLAAADASEFADLDADLLACAPALEICLRRYVLDRLSEVCD